jgi:uncharacterized protein YoaH (UPF0181 family)
MTVAARRFRLEIAGQLMVGLAFPSEADLEAWLLTRGALVFDGLASATSAQPRRQGRSSRPITPATPSRGPGRMPIDDADALAEIRALIAQGLDSAAAIRTVAQTMHGDIESVARRLRRKLRAPGQNAGQK